MKSNVKREKRLYLPSWEWRWLRDRKEGSCVPDPQSFGEDPDPGNLKSFRSGSGTLSEREIQVMKAKRGQRKLKDGKEAKGRKR